jgi:3-oxoacyl-[acyl-carrier-protein] synthase III
MWAAIKAIEYYFPERVLANSQLAIEFPEWTVEKIESKTGIVNRHIASEQECASDLGVMAAEKLFASGACTAREIDFLLFCTQSPDYYLPTTACLVQDRLGISTDSGALDFNLGCSGFVYGLSLAKGLIETKQAKSVLLITAETYSKFIYPNDKSVRTLFGDAAAATLVQNVVNPELVEHAEPLIGPFVFGTDGKGAENLIVPTGGMRKRRSIQPSLTIDEQGNARTENDLYMNGAEIFTFTLQAVPKAIKRILTLAEKELTDIDLFIFHQANKYMLDSLRRKTGIPEEKYYVFMKDCGNTVSSTIPIAMKHAIEEGRLRKGNLVMLVGFGVGYSWGATLVRWE